MTKVLDLIYEEALAKARLVQTWPGHFLVKKIETEIILKYFNQEGIKKGIGLEIGCGNAFQSVLLANFIDKFVATDLFTENNSSHTVGMARAKNLIEALNKEDVLLVSCSSLALPFPDNYFDLVFSSSALEHMDDKNLALKEMKRVLKPGGHSIIIVPTHMPSLYAFTHVYLYFLARISRLFFKPRAKSDKTEEGGGLSLPARFRKNYPFFPIPEPHGSYKNIFNELFSQFPFNWERIIRKNGFTIKRSFGICAFPWLLIEPFSTMAAARIFMLTKNVNIKLASLKPVQYISYLVGIISVKKG